jgi:Rieske Fe-S protein
MQQAAGRSRRAVLAAGSAGAVGAAAALAGCKTYGGGEDPPPEEPASGGPGTVLASTGEVEVGGGLILPDLGLVVTQPTAGTFKAFSAVCTHQGCLVSSVSDGTINCPCHGSQFSVQDGSVVRQASGTSAQQQPPLSETAITVEGDSIALA